MPLQFEQSNVDHALHVELQRLWHRKLQLGQVARGDGSFVAPLDAEREGIDIGPFGLTNTSSLPPSVRQKLIALCAPADAAGISNRPEDFPDEPLFVDAVDSLRIFITRLDLLEMHR